MSTSPSWFDQDKFSRLVKKVGTKTTTVAQPAASTPAPAKTPSQPLVREASLLEPTPPTKTIALKPLASAPIVKEAPLPEPEPAPAVPAPEQSLVKEAPLPAVVKTKAPPTEPPREKRLTQRLNAVDLAPRPPVEKPAPAPLHFEAGQLPAPEQDEDTPALPNPASRPSITPQRMMTSQPLAFARKSTTALASPAAAAAKAAPIRAPEASTPPAPAKTPPLPEDAQPIGGLPRRTAPLPALKSLFQYEIPGGQGTVTSKAPAESAPATPAPSDSGDLLTKPKTLNFSGFSFKKPDAKASPPLPPSVPDAEEDMPTFGGPSEDAGEELSAESLAAEWSKANDLTQITQERDELLKQIEELRANASAGGASSGEVEALTRERDEVRSEYIRLRGDFEKLKQDQLVAKSAPAAPSPETEQELQKLRTDAENLRAVIKNLREVAAKPNEELEKLRGEITALREEADKPNEEVEKLRGEIIALREEAARPNEEVEKLRMEVTALRAQADEPSEETEALHDEVAKLKEEATKASAKAGELHQEIEKLHAEAEEEIEKLHTEADELQREIEKLRAEASRPREDTGKLREESDRLRMESLKAKDEAGKLREQVAEKDREILAIKATSAGMAGTVENLKTELNGVRDEIKKAKDDASIAQRGLALSQKALQETRDALREASEATKK